MNAHQRRTVPLVAVSLVFAALITLFTVTVTQPAAVERVIGGLKVQAEATVAEVFDLPPPTVYLGVLGDETELDWCDGTFIELEPYRVDGVLPVYAAHNNCGGDIILTWDIGDTVHIGGEQKPYVVVEERTTRKWSQISSLRGMAGELALQTCFYGEDRMRFLSLAPAT